MKISLVIPVFNEAEQLSDCLRSVALQTRLPDEVIVVDNNSSDGSALIAQSFAFVRVVSEPRQGVVHARTRGFDEAKGEIIARIDADTRLPINWIETVATIFKDQSVDAVSGQARYHSIGLSPVFNQVDLFFRRRLSQQLKNHVYLWGANMAIRKKAWQKVKPDLCCRGKLHEDFDIGLHLQSIGCRVIFDERLIASISARRFAMDFKSFMAYIWMIPHTYQEHGLKAKRYLMPVVLVSAVGYWPGRLLHKGYDKQQGRFSLGTFLLTQLIGRVDPTSNVVVD